MSLDIKNLILFDTPLIIDHFPEYGKSYLECFDGELGGVDNLTIKISSLEHYCNMNNLNYYRTIEIIVELIDNENFNNNLCFEMNALPIIMTFLGTREYNKWKKIKENEKYNIPSYFEFISLNLEEIKKEEKKLEEEEEEEEKEAERKKKEEEKVNKKKDLITKIEEGIKKRKEIVKKSFKLEGLKKKSIILKKI